MGDSTILDTLIYSSIFSSPLTEDELYCYLHMGKILPKTTFVKNLENTQEYLVRRDGYVALKGGESLIARRVKRQSLYERKLRLAKRGARIISWIPVIYFIGLTGSVAAGNPGDDDIDFFIIARDGSIFSARFFSTVILSVLGVRRKKQEMHVSDKICLNMFCDVSGMGLFSQDKNIYVAREIAQMVPLFSRVSTYEKFLEKNEWSKRFIAHIGMKKNTCIAKNKSSTENLFLLLEPMCRFILNWIKLGRQVAASKDVNSFFFYPESTQKAILKKYRIAGGLL